MCYLDESDKELKKARERALYLLEYRDHSKKELLDKIKKTTPPEKAALVVDYMESIGLINDEVFAEKYARGLINRKFLFAGRLAFEMRKKGFSQDLIDEVLDKMTVDPIDQIRKLMCKKYPRAFCDEKQRQRAVSACQRLGYGWDDIKSAILLLQEECE